MIEVKELTVRFQSAEILRDVTFDIASGERVALIGASGVGKSVLLRTLNGLVRPKTGSVRIAGDLITEGGWQAQKARRATGMVFQQFNLFSHLRVVDNIALAPIRVGGIAPHEALMRAIELLELVGLADKRYAYPAELSGGQQQRVAIARALAMNPSVLLFDEPTSALDPFTATEVLTLIEKIIEVEGRTTLIVTHDMNFVQIIADRVFFVADGGIYEEGTTKDILDHPKREKTMKFVSQVINRGV